VPVPEPESEPDPVAEPIAPLPAPPAALAPSAARKRGQLDLSAIAAAPPRNDILDDDLLSWAEAQVPLEDVVARARAMAGDLRGEGLDDELAGILAAPLPIFDRESARAAIAELVPARTRA